MNFLAKPIIYKARSYGPILFDSYLDSPLWDGQGNTVTLILNKGESSIQNDALTFPRLTG